MSTSRASQIELRSSLSSCTPVRAVHSRACRALPLSNELHMHAGSQSLSTTLSCLTSGFVKKRASSFSVLKTHGYLVHLELNMPLRPVIGWFKGQKLADKQNKMSVPIRVKLSTIPVYNKVPPSYYCCKSYIVPSESLNEHSKWSALRQ